MKTFEVSFENCCNIHIDEETFKEGEIVLKFKGEFPTDMGNHIRVYPKKTYTEDDYEWVEETYHVIIGHENCEYGDCGSCHNVACGIYQGYTEEPTLEDCEPRTRMVRRLKPGR